MLMRSFYRVRMCMSVIIIFALLSAFGQEFSIVQLINPPPPLPGALPPPPSFPARARPVKPAGIYGERIVRFWLTWVN